MHPDLWIRTFIMENAWRNSLKSWVGPCYQEYSDTWMNEWKWVSFLTTKFLLFLCLLLISFSSSFFLFSFFSSFLFFSSSYAQVPTRFLFLGLFQSMCDFWGMKPTDISQSHLGIASQNEAGPSQQGIACSSDSHTRTLRFNLTGHLSDLKEFSRSILPSYVSPSALWLCQSLLSFTSCPGAGWIS